MSKLKERFKAHLKVCPHVTPEYKEDTLKALALKSTVSRMSPATKKSRRKEKKTAAQRDRRVRHMMDPAKITAVAKKMFDAKHGAKPVKAAGEKDIKREGYPAWVQEMKLCPNDPPAALNQPNAYNMIKDYKLRDKKRITRLFHPDKLPRFTEEAETARFVEVFRVVRVRLLGAGAPVASSSCFPPSSSSSFILASVATPSCCARGVARRNRLERDLPFGDVPSLAYTRAMFSVGNNPRDADAPRVPRGAAS